MAVCRRYRMAKENRAQCPHRAGAAPGARGKRQPEGWGLLQSWLQRRQRQSVPAYVTLDRRNQKAHQYGGLSAGLRDGTCCGWVLVSGFTQRGLLFSYSCEALPSCLYSINVILERMRYLLGMWGEQAPAC